MSKLIYISYSPNTRREDLLLNIKLLFKSNKRKEANKGSCNESVISFFKTKFKDSINAYTFNYARSGMYVLFSSLNLSNDSEVLVQGFTCSAAINPILWAGLKVKYVDIDMNTGNMDIDDLRGKITDRTKAIMFQHTFGNSRGMEEVRDICNERDLILIEDCTNTILGKFDNKLLGSYGDFSIFSFGRDKAVSGVSGGLILINTSKYISKFEELYNSLPYPSFSWTFKELLYPLIWELIKKTFNIKIGKGIHFISEKLNLLTRASTPHEKVGRKPDYIPSRLPDSLACLALRQLNDIEIFNQHRVRINNMYHEGLSDVTQISFFKYSEGNVLLRFPLLVEDRDNLVTYLKNRNILVGDWYNSPITPSSGDLTLFGYESGACPVSEDVCSRIINLPNHINMREEDVQSVIRCIRGFYGV